MQPLLTALISVVVASIIGFISSHITILVERRKLKIDLQKAYAVELFKIRLATYPEVWKALGDLSEQAVVPLDSETTKEIARKVAREVNQWLYAAGGLCADKASRRALLDVRNACLDFPAVSAPQIREFRDKAMIYLRRDLALKGLESFDPGFAQSPDE